MILTQGKVIQTDDRSLTIRLAKTLLCAAKSSSSIDGGKSELNHNLAIIEPTQFAHAIMNLLVCWHPLQYLVSFAKVCDREVKKIVATHRQTFPSLLWGACRGRCNTRRSNSFEGATESDAAECQQQIIGNC